MEGVNGFSHTLVTTSQFSPDLPGCFPLLARQQYLTPPHPEGIGGPKASVERCDFFLAEFSYF
jgi:hypothetical protein